MLKSLLGAFKANNRKQKISSTYFEALESRQLLSASPYNAASFGNSTWHIVGQDFEGVFVLASNSATVSSGTLTKDDGSTLNLAGATFSYTTGTAKGILTLTYGGLGDPDRFEINARLSSTDDYATGGDSDGLGQATMVRQADDAFKTNASSELIGTWSLTGEETSGSITIGYSSKSNGLVVSSASLKVDGKAIAINAAKSTVELDSATGKVTLTLRNSAGTSPRVYTGYLTDAGDFVSFKETSNKAGNDMLVALKVGAKGSYSSADLPESILWSMTSQQYNGRFELAAPDSKGVIAISGTSLRMYVGKDIDNVDKSVTGVNAKGTLAIDKNGKVTLKLTFNPGTLSANTITLTGQMNSTKNSIALLSADGSNFMILTTNFDHASTLNNTGKTVNVGTVVGGQGTSIDYTTLTQTYGGLTDIDGANELPPSVAIKVASGTLVYTDGVTTFTKTSADGFFVLNKTATNIKYYTAAGASTSKFVVGLYVALTGNAAENTSAKLAFRRASNEVTPSVNKNNATQPTTNGGTDYTYGEFKLTRTSTTGTPTVTFKLSGTGEYGVDYVVTDAAGNTLTPNSGNFTISFASNAKTAFVRIVPLYFDPATTATGNRTVTLTVSTPAFDSGYEAAKTTAATLTIKGKHDAADTAVSVSKVSKSTITEDTTNDQTIFTISRGSTTNGSFSLEYTLTGIDGRYDPIEVSTDGVNWTTPSNTTINFGTTDKNVFVRLTMAGSAATKLPTATAVFSISILTKKDLFYVDATGASKSVIVDDIATA